MSEEEIEIFKNLIEYMQNSIDDGYHKFIYNDLDWDFKCIDCINALNTAMELQNELDKEKEKNRELEDKIKEYEKIFNRQKELEHEKNNLMKQGWL